MNIIKILGIVSMLSLYACSSNDTSKQNKEVEENNQETPADEIQKTEVIDDIITPVEDSIEITTELEEEIIENEKTLKEVAPIQEVAKKATTEKKIVTETIKEVKQEVKPKVITLSHTIFNDLLKKHVSSTGIVNYNGLLKDKAQLENYLALLETNSAMKNFTKNQKLAYYINLYNASTIHLILNNYPLKSITKINNGKAWDKKFIKLGGKIVSLNHIENDIIRPQFKEARIHFAVNCAANSCPKLLNEAFNPSQLERQFNKAATYFVNNSAKNKLTENEIQISKIFDWYGSDFNSYGGVLSFIKKYSTINIQSDAKITYLEYDWKLNGK